MEKRSMSTTRLASNVRRQSFVHAAARIFNPLVLGLAGTRLLPLYGVLYHRGRRSGAIYHTPVVVRQSDGGFIVPMPWGESTDWFRNVRAAGACVIRWKGREYAMHQPRVIDAAETAAAFGGFSRVMMHRLGIRVCLRLEHRA
jgi:deazaflavin-dependent oxidoreductase (nitroreductase family)